MHSLHIASLAGNNLMLENINTLAPGTSNDIYFVSNINGPGSFKYTSAIKSIGTASNTAKLSFFTFAGSTPNSMEEQLTIMDNGNVGINNPNPDHQLDVTGSINCTGTVFTNQVHSYGNVYANGVVGIGTTAPSYKLQVNDGSLAVYNTTDDKFWTMSYISASNHFTIREDGTSRLTISNGGNIGISNLSPTARLDVVGSGKFSDNLDVAGNITSNSDGIVSSGDNTQLKLRTYTATLTVGGLPVGSSATGTIHLGASTFSGIPTAYLGNITNENGDYAKATIILENVTQTSITVRVVNLSSSPISFVNATWKVLVVGPR
jgi:hypothetical protein